LEIEFRDPVTGSGDGSSLYKGEAGHGVTGNASTIGHDVTERFVSRSYNSTLPCSPSLKSAPNNRYFLAVGLLEKFESARKSRRCILCVKRCALLGCKYSPTLLHRSLHSVEGRVIALSDLNCLIGIIEFGDKHHQYVSRHSGHKNSFGGLPYGLKPFRANPGQSLQSPSASRSPAAYTPRL
jgi:hypothetical protein